MPHHCIYCQKSMPSIYNNSSSFFKLRNSLLPAFNCLLVNIFLNISNFLWLFIYFCHCSFNCNFTAEGKLLCWGWNEHGMCGNGSLINVSLPSEVTVPFRGVLSVGCGAGHSYALVYRWWKVEHYMCRERQWTSRKLWWRFSWLLFLLVL